MSNFLGSVHEMCTLRSKVWSRFDGVTPKSPVQIGSYAEGEANGLETPILIKKNCPKLLRQLKYEINSI